jgi:hypothetical protein
VALSATDPIPEPIFISEGAGHSALVIICQRFYPVHFLCREFLLSDFGLLTAR